MVSCQGQRTAPQAVGGGVSLKIIPAPLLPPYICFSIEDTRAIPKQSYIGVRSVGRCGKRVKDALVPSGVKFEGDSTATGLATARITAVSGDAV